MTAPKLILVAALGAALTFILFAAGLGLVEDGAALAVLAFLSIFVFGLMRDPSG